jgi:hypothetical protein
MSKLFTTAAAVILGALLLASPVLAEAPEREVIFAEQAYTNTVCGETFTINETNRVTWLVRRDEDGYRIMGHFSDHGNGVSEDGTRYIRTTTITEFQFNTTLAGGETPHQYSLVAHERIFLTGQDQCVQFDERTMIHFHFDDQGQLINVQVDREYFNRDECSNGLPW